MPPAIPSGISQTWRARDRPMGRPKRRRNRRLDRLNRGDIVTVALQGEFGKPRPAVIVQSDSFNASHATVSILPITSTIVGAPLFRITIEPSPANGLRSVSQVMADKVVSVRRERLGPRIGSLDREAMARIGRSLALWLELA